VAAATAAARSVEQPVERSRMSSELAYINLDHEQDRWASPNSIVVMDDACMMFIKFT
jgi:hypothetical protein